MGFFGLFKGVSAKLMVLVGIGLVSLSLMVGISVISFKELSSTVETLVDSRIPVATLIGEMRSQSNAVAKQLFHSASITDPKEKENSLEEVQRRLSKLDQSLIELSKQSLTKKNEERLEKISSTWSKTKATVENLVKLLFKQEANNNLLARVNDDIQGLESINNTLLEMNATNNERNTLIKKEALEKISSSSFMLYACAGTAYCLLILLGLWMALGLKKSLSNITNKIADSGSFVRGSSQELSGASQGLSTSQTETAASLEETVASIEELSSIVVRNAEQAKVASQLSTESADTAKISRQEVQKLITSVQSIADSSKKIDEIITIIDDIAFQTNLLALNAAVEAARAGEQGKGFAVVADAVRSLAQRSASAAKDISSLISQSVSQSNQGAKLAVESGEVLDRVTISIQKVAEINKEMAAASQEQASGLKQISQAMNTLDQATQGNSAAAEQTAATSEQMSAQAEVLAELVKDLQRVVNGGSDGHSGRPTEDKDEANKISTIKGKQLAQKIPFDIDRTRKTRGISDASGF
ncbi:MAG: methyl-accepting chemotaxis protein [Bdellovibrio sp.]